MQSGKPKLRLVQGSKSQPQLESRSRDLLDPFDPYAQERPPQVVDFSEIRADIEVRMKFLELSWSHPRIQAWMKIAGEASQVKGGFKTHHHLPIWAYEQLQMRLKEQMDRLHQTTVLLSQAGYSWSHSRVVTWLQKTGATRATITPDQLDQLDRALRELIKQQVAESLKDLEPDW